MTIEERQNLINKTDEALEYLLADLKEQANESAKKRNAASNKVKANANELANDILNFVKKFNDDDSLEVQINDVRLEKPHSWDDNKTSAFKFICSIGVKRKTEEQAWPDGDFWFTIYDDHIESSTTGYGTFSRKDRPCIPPLLIIQGNVWANEIMFVAKAIAMIDITLLNAYETAINEYYEIEADIRAINAELKRRDDIAKRNVLINALKMHKYYVYECPDYYNTKEVYKILSVSDKLVKVQRIYFSSSYYYETENFHYEGEIKHIKLDDNAIRMLKVGRATLTDDISEFVNKAKESFEKWKAANPDAYKAWKTKYSK